MKQYKLICTFCKNNFLRDEVQMRVAKARNQRNFFCNQKCRSHYSKSQHLIEINCANCSSKLIRYLKESSKSKNQFCDHSCSALFNNKIRRKSNRSKSESLLHSLIIEEFPNLEVINNDRSFLDGYELDIFIPSIKLAIEWNGIVHFQPIYGEDKLKRIQEIDSIKCELAKSKGINLIVIPDLKSTKNYVHEVFYRIKELIYKLIAIAGSGTAPD